MAAGLRRVWSCSVAQVSPANAVATCRLSAVCGSSPDRTAAFSLTVPASGAALSMTVPASGAAFCFTVPARPETFSPSPPPPAALLPAPPYPAVVTTVSSPGPPVTLSLVPEALAATLSLVSAALPTTLSLRSAAFTLAVSTERCATFLGLIFSSSASMSAPSLARVASISRSSCSGSSPTARPPSRSRSCAAASGRTPSVVVTGGRQQLADQPAGQQRGGQEHRGPLGRERLDRDQRAGPGRVRGQLVVGVLPGSPRLRIARLTQRDLLGHAVICRRRLEQFRRLVRGCGRLRGRRYLSRGEQVVIRAGEGVLVPAQGAWVGHGWSFRVRV